MSQKQDLQLCGYCQPANTLVGVQNNAFGVRSLRIFIISAAERLSISRITHYLTTILTTKTHLTVLLTYH